MFVLLLCKTVLYSASGGINFQLQVSWAWHLKGHLALFIVSMAENGYDSDWFSA